MGQERQGSGSSGGCSCSGMIIAILVLWALCFGLPTPWGTLNIDILPPRIWRMDTPGGQ